MKGMTERRDRRVKIGSVPFTEEDNDTGNLHVFSVAAKQKNRVVFLGFLCAVRPENLFQRSDDWILNVGSVQADAVLDPRELDESREAIQNVR